MRSSKCCALTAGGGSPHFCSDFALPPPALRVIPLTPCRQYDRYQTAHLVERTILTHYPAVRRTGHKRLTRSSEASLHTSPQTVKQITPPHPKAQTSPYPRKKQKMLPTIPKSVHSAMNPQHFLGILLFFIYLIWTIFFQKIFDFLPLMCYNNLYRE